MARVTYNERSWAIDVISEINLYLSTKDWFFKSAGGENTIRNEKTSLFPDILIFKDSRKNIILHGWELKMPDTHINDASLINNAITKARILQRSSFVLWNVKSAVLYVKNEDSFILKKSWEEIAINTRAEVRANEPLWKTLLHTILDDLNNFFISGTIDEMVYDEILSIDKIIDVVLDNIPSTVINIKKRARRDARLDAQINSWWLSSATEYGYNPSSSGDNQYKFPLLSKVALTDWVFKILFANILKRHFNEARQIENITSNTTISEAKQIIQHISEQCDFWNIFSDNLAIELISETAWKQLVQLNLFLSSINIEEIEIEVLHDLLQSSIASAKRKVAGQFATPKELADFMTRLTINNKEGVVLDPCCGTGTIIKQAYLLKQEYGIVQDCIIDGIWASDKHSFPIQLSTLSLTRPNNIGKVLNVFRDDVIDLEIGKVITFRDPHNGEVIEKTLPPIDYIVSNLPFIKSKEIKILNPNITEINDCIQTQANINNSLSGKSDVYAYIPFYLHKILNDHARIGLILSNSWLGTDYGETFIELFQQYYDIEIVVVSGKGKWFNNADIVTTFLIATKRNPTDQINANNIISFCTLKEKIESIDSIRQLSDDIILRRESEQVEIQSYSLNQIRDLEGIGIPWSGYFTNLDWLPDITDKIINANQVFHFTRGERRGWNPLFYPADGHGIEEEYIQPVLKNLRGTTSLTCVADAEAFCCSQSIEELEALNHAGALNWIRSFENQTNNTGIPLVQSLRKANLHWYEMNTRNMADFVANVNYDKSLFIAGFEVRSFIDQRMIGFSVKETCKDEDKALFLALLNSILSMFFIESFGFGRGLGALDLRATKFERDFKILNPNLLNSGQKTEIIEAFQPITQRDRLTLEQEILAEDRVSFEHTLFNIYGIAEYYNPIKNALLHLYKIRFAVNE